MIVRADQSIIKFIIIMHHCISHPLFRGKKERYISLPLADPRGKKIHLLWMQVFNA